MPRVRKHQELTAVGVAVLLLTGCSLDSLLKNDQLPPEVSDPAITQTPAGAMTVYRGTILQLQNAFGNFQTAILGNQGNGSGQSSFVPLTGLLTDELQQATGLGFATPLPVDQRSVLEGTTPEPTSADAYSNLQRTRGQAGQAIQLLVRYLPEQPALAGHMYAVEAYAEIMLAEVFCSGIPLSTIDYGGDYTYRPGSTTAQVFAHALALLDTGLTLATDSARFVNLIRVAQGRVRLALGQYAAAGAAAATVPDNYTYALSYSAMTAANNKNFAASWTSASFTYGVADREGVNGLDYRASGDPRTAATLMTRNSLDGVANAYRLNRYATNGSTPIVLASGVEARLIQAEAALQAGDAATWLATLNALRTDGTYDTTATSPPDTLWHAGTGGVARLKPLADPGASLSGAAADSARVDLLFRERAFWLFLTGHRQGDLRRLVRVYGRPEDAVYPTGEYQIPGNLYGTNVSLPIPPAERTSNPLFTGCISTDA